MLRHRDELKPEAADRLEGTTRHRDEVKRGARDVLDGTIEQVTCSVPAALDLRLATSRQTVRLHSEDYFKVQFGAANFTPTGELHPCTELQGTRARVFFWHVQGAPYDGEIISVELRK